MTTRTPILLILTASLIAGVLSALVLSQGINMNADGWAFWSGAVSLAEGQGYTHFYGNAPIWEWPPTFSYFIAAWQSVFGVSVRTLIYSTVFLSVLAVLLWGWFFHRLAELFTLSDRLRLLFHIATLLFLAAFIPYYYKSLLIDNLRFALLPLYLHFFMNVVRAETESARWKSASGLILTGMLLAVIHNANLAFVGAAVVMLPCIVRPKSNAFVIAAASLVLPVAAWYLVRVLFVLHPGHGFFFRLSFDSIALLLPKLLQDTANLLFGETAWKHYGLLLAIGLAIIIAWRIRGQRSGSGSGKPEKPNPVGVLLIFAGLALLLNTAMCYVVQLSTVTRYIWFIPLLLVPLLFLQALRVSPRVLYPMSLAVFLLPALGKIVLLIFFTLTDWGNYVSAKPLEAFVRSDMFIEREYATGDPQRTEKGVLVSPPLYPWVEKRAVR